jgi:hypothetical protein
LTQKGAYQIAVFMFGNENWWIHRFRM